MRFIYEPALQEYMKKQRKDTIYGRNHKYSP